MVSTRDCSVVKLASERIGFSDAKEMIFVALLELDGYLCSFFFSSYLDSNSPGQLGRVDKEIAIRYQATPSIVICVRICGSSPFQFLHNGSHSSVTWD
jgi:hypothetical protein